jgi:hypothetical protein
LDDAPLPFEVRAEEKGLAASGAAGGDFPDGGTKYRFRTSKRAPTGARKRKRKEAAPEGAPEAKLPGMD